MPNSTITWLDPQEHPATIEIMGETIALKNKKGSVCVLVLVILGNDFEHTVNWLNQSEYMYIVLPK